MPSHARRKAPKPSPYLVVRAVHPFPAVLVAAATVALARVAGADLFITAVLGVGMLCYQFSIGLSNDARDAAADAEDRPWKPIPAGVLSLRMAVRGAVLLAAAGMLVTLSLPLGAWALGVAGLACGVTYNLWLKRTVLSWLPFSIALPLVPAWVYVAVGEWDGLLWWTFPLGALLGLALHLANQAPDIIEEAPGEAGLAGLLGTRVSYALAVTLFGIAGTVTVLVLLSRSGTIAVYVAALVAAVAIASMRARAMFGAGALFALLATGTAVLSVLFIAAVER